MVLLVVHTGRAEAVRVAGVLIDRLAAAGISTRVLAPEAAMIECRTTAVPVTEAAAAGTEMVLVVGGDGTLLRAAELARPAGVPLLGVNLGHVGFLAEAEPEDLSAAIASLAARQYSVEKRMTVEVAVRNNGTQVAATWALNEATVEKAARERMLDLVIEVDGRPLSRWGCDGVVFATPTGSTAYAFSAGGPVVWPEVDALLMVPISAHALFAGPMVVSPQSVLAAEVIGVAGGQSETAGAVLWCDGRRTVELPPGSRVEVRRGELPVLLARLPEMTGTETRIGAPFTDRLVAKFGLPVAGWRGRGGRGAGPVAGALAREYPVEREYAGQQADEEPSGHA
ncbi:MAG: NAD kinase [Actinobacteria bacterium]|nr:NAD kinase [Actinomycetota bacterium]